MKPPHKVRLLAILMLVVGALCAACAAAGGKPHVSAYDTVGVICARASLSDCLALHDTPAAVYIAAGPKEVAVSWTLEVLGHVTHPAHGGLPNSFSRNFPGLALDKTYHGYAYGVLRLVKTPTLCMAFTPDHRAFLLKCPGRERLRKHLKTFKDMLMLWPRTSDQFKLLSVAGTEHVRHPVCLTLAPKQEVEAPVRVRCLPQYDDQQELLLLREAVHRPHPKPSSPSPTPKPLSVPRVSLRLAA